MPIGLMCFALGLIPAHAGKTWPSPTVLKSSWAHPRSRGENLIGVAADLAAQGSSPLTRGKRPGALDRLAGQRLIPAHAGKTLSDLHFYRTDRSDLGKP